MAGDDALKTTPAMSPSIGGAASSAGIDLHSPTSALHHNFPLVAISTIPRSHPDPLNHLCIFVSPILHSASEKGER